MSKSNLVVVLPEPDGHVGAVVVHDAAGEQVLDEPYAAVGGSAGAKTLRPVAVAPEEVARTFGPALAARPLPPKRFTLFFVSDTDDLTDESRAAFESVFEDVARRPAPDVVVTGHTDTVAEPAYNDALSLRRAEAVRDLLVARGLPREAVIATGRGEREPRVPSADDVRDPQNRRVEITVR